MLKAQRPGDWRQDREERLSCIHAEINNLIAVSETEGFNHCKPPNCATIKTSCICGALLGWFRWHIDMEPARKHNKKNRAAAWWNRASWWPVLQSQDYRYRILLQKSLIFTTWTERVAAVMWYFLAVSQNVVKAVSICASAEDSGAHAESDKTRLHL